MNCNFEFKQFGGYLLLSRIFTSMTLTNKKFQIDKYYKIIINNCFKEPVICLNDYINQNNFNNLKSISSIYLVNPNLLSNILLEWKFLRYSSLSVTDKHSLCNYLFQILLALLIDTNNTTVSSPNSSSFNYHSTIFFNYDILDKLMNYLFDANTDSFVFDDKLCYLFVDIFKQFNLVCNSFASKTKDLLKKFFNYLILLHPQSNFIVISSKKQFYNHICFSKFVSFYVFFLNRNMKMFKFQILIM
jgi:hypothetical protein